MSNNDDVIKFKKCTKFNDMNRHGGGKEKIKFLYFSFSILQALTWFSLESH